MTEKRFNITTFTIYVFINYIMQNFFILIYFHWTYLNLSPESHNLQKTSVNEVRHEFPENPEMLLNWQNIV